MLARKRGKSREKRTHKRKSVVTSRLVGVRRTTTRRVEQEDEEEKEEEKEV